jgi:hypothetical protein
MWADRVTGSALGDQLVRDGRASREDLRAIAGAWLAWADDQDGWISVPHGELLVTQG